MKKLILKTDEHGHLLINKVIHGQAKITSVVASGVDHLDRWVNIFVDTDRETGAIRLSADGGVMLNVRAQTERPAQTPGQVLPAQAPVQPAAPGFVRNAPRAPQPPQDPQNPGQPPMQLGYLDDDIPF